jgi:hypothetical protein
MKTPTIYEVLNEAIDSINRGMYTSPYTCDHINAAIRTLMPVPPGSSPKVLANVYQAQHKLRKLIETGLRKLGLEPDTIDAFDDIKDEDKRFQARILWLTMLVTLAEEQGV